MIGSSTDTAAAPRAVITPPTNPVRGLGAADASFERVIKQVERDADISQAARTLTAHALILPVLKELRGGSMAWGPFKANDAEKSFGPILDTTIADRIASSPRLPVAAAIEARLRAREQGVG